MKKTKKLKWTELNELMLAVDKSVTVFKDRDAVFDCDRESDKG